MFSKMNLILSITHATADWFWAAPQLGSLTAETSTLVTTVHVIGICILTECIYTAILGSVRVHCDWYLTIEIGVCCIYFKWMVCSQFTSFERSITVYVPVKEQISSMVRLVLWIHYSCFPSWYRLTAVKHWTSLLQFSEVGLCHG